MSESFWLAGLPLNGEAALIEAKRLRKTITLAEEAITCACEYKQQAGALAADHLGASGALFATALAVESAAKACRKAARSALAGLKVFPDLWSAEKIAAKIETARSAAFALQATCDSAQRFNASLQISAAARDLKRAVAECAAKRDNGGRAE